MAKPKPRRQCDCVRCKGKIVASSTWYLHNPGGNKIRYLLPQETIDVILRQPNTNVFPQARKRRLDQVEEVEGSKSKRATGSRPVDRSGAENVHRVIAASEMSQSLHPATPLEPKGEIHPSPPSLGTAVAPINVPTREPHSPSTCNSATNGLDSSPPDSGEDPGLLTGLQAADFQ